MNKFRREILWAALVLIILLTAMSIYGAFIGADRAQVFFNSTPSAVFWAFLAMALIGGFVAFRRLIRVPGLLLMHAGCILILIGGALGSEKGYKATGNDKLRKGQMKIYEGQISNQVGVFTKKLLFSLGLEFEHSFHGSAVQQGSVVPQELRQEFEKQQRPLSQNAFIQAQPAGNAWTVGDNSKQYSVKKEDDELKVYLTWEMKELPFSIKLNDFTIEYYEPKFEYLDYETAKGMQRVAAEIGLEVDLGAEHGTAKITRKFRNLKVSMDGGKTQYYDDQSPNPNPALELQITKPDGQVASRIVYSLHPEFSHNPGGPKLIYVRPPYTPISDYISELEVIDTDGKVLAKKDIEVNHPLQYGGYRFYQSGYDDKAAQYTVLQVVSDTGVMIVFAGYWLLCVGVVWHMWLRHLFKNIGSKKQTDGN